MAEKNTLKLISLFYISGGLYVPQSSVLDSVPVFYAATVSLFGYHSVHPNH